MPRGDERSRNFPVKVRLKNQFDAARHPLVKSGMFARVWLPVERREIGAARFRKTPIVMGGPVPIVYVAERNAPAPPRPRPSSLPVHARHGVRRLHRSDRARLAPGMELVIEGNERLRPGQPMRIVAASREARRPRAATGRRRAVPAGKSSAIASLPSHTVRRQRNVARDRIVRSQSGEGGRRRHSGRAVRRHRALSDADAADARRRNSDASRSKRAGPARARKKSKRKSSKSRKSSCRASKACRR